MDLEFKPSLALAFLYPVHFTSLGQPTSRAASFSLPELSLAQAAHILMNSSPTWEIREVSIHCSGLQADSACSHAYQSWLAAVIARFQQAESISPLLRIPEGMGSWSQTHWQTKWLGENPWPVKRGGADFGPGKQSSSVQLKGGPPR
jgi:hypothetical protein